MTNTSVRFILHLGNTFALVSDNIFVGIEEKIETMTLKF